MNLEACIHVVSPTVIERARRLEVAISMLQGGLSRREASSLLQIRFHISQPTAWRLVDMANDVAGKVP
jgi:hypothetical protein